MGKLHKFAEHSLKVANKISEDCDLNFSTNIIDIPGLADAQGRSNTLDYPILSKKNAETHFRIYFTYNLDISNDIDGKSLGDINQGYKTPWLRMVFYIDDKGKVNFYRIHKREKSILNTLSKLLFITPGKEIVPTTKTKNYYFLECPVNKGDIISNIQSAELLKILEDFPNLKMIKVDSKELVVDIQCDEIEQYTEELILRYLKIIESLMPVMLKI